MAGWRWRRKCRDGLPIIPFPLVPTARRECAESLAAFMRVAHPFHPSNPRLSALSPAPPERRCPWEIIRVHLCPSVVPSFPRYEYSKTVPESATMSSESPLFRVFTLADCNDLCISIEAVGGRLGERLGAGVGRVARGGREVARGIRRLGSARVNVAPGGIRLLRLGGRGMVARRRTTGNFTNYELRGTMKLSKAVRWVLSHRFMRRSSLLEIPACAGMTGNGIIHRCSSSFGAPYAKIL